MSSTSTATLLSLPLLIFFFSSSFALSETKEGLCAPPNRLFITGTMQKCTTDTDCPYDTKCCESKSRTKVCAPAQPAYSACQHQRVVAEEIGRSLESSINFTPECTETNGSFAAIQCSESKQRCWCVNEAGFEVPGTRAPLGTSINCSAPRPCPNPECRMLCPQSFRIMKDGCPVCECYDACNEIKCPRSTKCVTEELTCVSEPCPPISRCSARSIDDVDCPNGLPALVDTNKKDYYLCSLLDTVRASKCPAGFDCNVRLGKEFGVCCPQAPQNVIKAGQCPALNITDHNSCVVECRVDQDCYGDSKCCSDNCTARCLPPVTLTACQAQRAAVTNVPGLFAPTCDAATGGQYSQVQCSGQKCWCVDPLTGVEKSGTRTVNGSLPNCAAPKTCVAIKCDLQCDHGPQFDADGCPVCSCFDPCEELSCSNGCNLLNVDCGEHTCPSVATCKESRSLDHPCIYGKPVLDNRTRDYLICGDAGSPIALCPTATKCEPIDAEGHGVCCPMPGTVPSKQLHGDSTELTLAKPTEHFGKCPKIPTVTSKGLLDCGKTCKKDQDCAEAEKCCDNDCGMTCAKAMTKTACQGSAEFWLASGLNPVSTFVPKCDLKGGFKPIQCLEGKCWCVDNFGREIDGTRKPEGQLIDCSKPKDCGPQCRMFCPYGFAREEDGCASSCECAPSPCDKITCPEETECKISSLECVKEPCPLVPKCIPKPVTHPVCPFGEPLVDAFSNKTIPCGSPSEAVEGSDCPVTHVCTQSTVGGDGVCCQRQTVDICHLPKEVGPCRAAIKKWHYNKTSSQCEEFIWGGCDGNLNNFQTKDFCQSMCRGMAVRKSGNCPLPPMEGAGTCQLECGSDEDCPGSSKCCSNGCGKVCMAETFQSACEIQNAALARLLPMSTSALREKAFIPECQSDGSFSQRQCSNPLGLSNSTSKECWCVNPQNGMEIDGSRRVASATQVDCATIGDNLCKETMMCRMDCPFGFKHDASDGCPVCDCEDPCELYECHNGRECKVMDLKSLHNVTTRIPICTPRPSAALTCPFGQPIRVAVTDQIQVCFTDAACPDTHTCSIPEGAHAGICCSKSSSVCQMLPEVGPCRGTIPRWSFDPTSQTCKRFLYGGCQGNGNNFVDSSECLKVCGGGATGHVAPANASITVPERPKSANTSVALNELCLTGTAMIPVLLATGLSNNSIEACSETTGCPLSHSCVRSNGQVACCPKTADDCFLPLISGQCKASVQRFHFNPKTKTCDPFVYSGCNANGNNFATDSQCRSLCPVMSQCEALHQAAVRLQSTSSVPIFIPECDEFDGTWLPVQCQPAVGMCWCVDEQGHADMTTAVRGYPKCRGRVSGESSALNASADVCADGEAMQFCDPQLCRHQVCFGHPRAQCRINPCGGCTTDFVDSDNEKVDCNQGLSECQIEFQTTVHSTSWSKLQIPAPLFAPGTKSSANGAEVVQIIERDENTTSKLGLCPPYFALPHEGCLIECHSDAQCAGDSKCCFAGCGYTCVSPIPIATAKPGQCPVTLLPDVAIVEGASEKCDQHCVDDTECGANKKCCSRGKCDLVCLDPVVEPVLMPLYMPTCSISGHFDWTQCSGEMCWCVDGNGTIRPETVTRGQIQCNESGISVGAIRSVCPGDGKAEICKETCRDARCAGRPDAFCVADPCNKCKVQFVDQQGKTVRCEDACHFPLEKGTCNAEGSERFYFNAFTQECRTFNYTGCGGNENNFVSKDECLNRCLPKDICMQEISTGPCRALIERWAYNRKTHQCEQFDYGGCHGNGNNFETKSACEARCPEILVCPKLSAAATVSTCNRSGVCEQAKCGHPLAECRVEPCSCAAEFVDKWGRRMNCSALPTRCQQESLERSVMADIYHPQCTLTGKYQPLQCFADHFSENCWCVDESGYPVDDMKFSRGSRKCGIVKIEATRIYLRFSARPEVVEDSIRDAVTEILNQVSQENAVDGLEILPAKHHIAATLVLHGERAADIAYFFEKKLNLTKLPPALSLLQLRIDHERPTLNTLMDDRALSPIIFIDSPAQANGQDLLPLLAILGVIVILAAGFGVYLYRRRRTGSYTNRQQTKTPDLEKVLPSDATMKVVPNDYASTPELTKPQDHHIYETPRDNVML